MMTHIHWLTVSYVSPDTKETILAHGGRVDVISHDPPFVAVGLAYDQERYQSWSHGRLQWRDAIECWNTGQIQMEQFTLQWGPNDAWAHSAAETYLIQPWEEFDKTLRQVTENQEATAAQQPAVVGSTDDFDPFLDRGDLP